MQTVEGLDELDRSIEEMVRNISGPELEKAVAAAGAEVLKEVEVRAPVHTGALRASISTFAKGRDGKATSIIQVANSKKGGIRFYAVMLEYGTSKMSPRPFMRPAFDAAAPKAVQRFTDELNEIIKDR